ncbi:hypothetical protein BDC45DRAFT_524321, partial [Circinella umbellata]
MNRDLEIKDINYTHREIVSYREKKVTLNFESDEAFKVYENNILSKHATWCYHQQYKSSANSVACNSAFSEARLLVLTVKYRCDHAGKPKHKKDYYENIIVKNDKNTNSTPFSSTFTPVIKKRRVSPSIKVGCTAYYNKKTFANGEVELVYNWEHCNHDPTDPSSYTSESRLSEEIKKWIVDAVDKHMDWKSIKTAL